MSLIRKIIEEKIKDEDFDVVQEAEGDEDKPRGKSKIVSPEDVAKLGRQDVKAVKGGLKDIEGNISVRISRVSDSKRIITINVVGPKLDLSEVRHLLLADPDSQGMSVTL